MPISYFLFPILILCDEENPRVGGLKTALLFGLFQAQQDPNAGVRLEGGGKDDPA